MKPRPRVVIIFSPFSGRGRGEAMAKSLARGLSAAGFSVPIAPAQERPDLHGAAAVVAVGGDGTVHHALDAVARAGVPLYHAPAGTENLFARSLGMTGDVGQIEEALRTGRSRRVDVGVCNGRAFAVMAGVGPDAEVIREMNARRAGPISRLSYAVPVLRRLRAPGGVTAVLELGDGGAQDRVHLEGPGQLVVANSPRYALGLDPARRADMSDGLLDMVHVPVSSSLGLLAWGVRLRLGLHMRHPRAFYRRGGAFTVTLPAHAPFQLDGEDAGKAGVLRFSVRPGGLSVLAPA